MLIQRMMLQTEFQELGWRGRYERLCEERTVIRTRRFLIMRRVDGRIKGVKLSRARKLNWKPFSIMFVLSRKIAGFVKRMKMDDACPAIIFSCQWGLPVISHSSVNTRKTPISSYRGLTWF
ncbi:hypothetical protein Salat_1522400 [Sesamum alatum]|uniref:Uncharacterized protein n=1 Tax=Sesamum alatum TaxID=300844 RepID=A0AAE2CMF1_9LAMI|nr:hypothetical protein Salat_1522400 [Sesamum alatum]